MGRLKMLAIPSVFFVMVSIGWLGQAPSLLANPPPMMEPSYMSSVRLIHSFEDLLGRQAGLLHSFEMLVGHFEVPPVELLASYEDLLHRQVELLHSYEDLAKPFVCTPMRHPELELVASFEKLLHGQAKLLFSFEALIHRYPMPPMPLARSFESLVRDQADLLHSFEEMLHCLAEMHHLPPRTLYGFVTSFEELLRSQAGLLQSFESMIKGQGAHSMESPSMHMPFMPKEPYEHPDEEPMLPSLEEMMEHGDPHALADHLKDVLEHILEAMRIMRAQGHMAEAHDREALLAEFRTKLTKLQSKLLQNNVSVEMTGMTDVPNTYQVTVENRGSFAVSLATLLVFEGKRMIYSQSLGYLEPGEHRILILRVDARNPWDVRAMATGFIDFITKLMAMAMTDRY